MDWQTDRQTFVIVESLLRLYNRGSSLEEVLTLMRFTWFRKLSSWNVIKVKSIFYIIQWNRFEYNSKEMIFTNNCYLQPHMNLISAYCYNLRDIATIWENKSILNREFKGTSQKKRCQICTSLQCARRLANVLNWALGPRI